MHKQYYTYYTTYHYITHYTNKRHIYYKQNTYITNKTHKKHAKSITSRKKRPPSGMNIFASWRKQPKIIN